MHLSEPLLTPARPLRWLYVDFNSYFASVEQQLQPALRGKPVVVIPVESEATSAIAASYEAKHFGIKTNTPVHEARRLCPEAVFVLANHEHYVTFHQRIIDEVNRHIPVSVVASIDEVACRLMDNENSPQRVVEIAHAIKAGLACNVGEYIRCSIGVSSNRYLAKVATDMQKPDGLVLLPADEALTRLLPLPLRDLPGIGHGMEQRLKRAGIYDMRSLLALSSDQMRRIWGGVWGERMWYLLRGVELPETETTRRTIGHSHVLAPHLRPLLQARFVARRLALKACSRLRRMGYVAGVFSLSLRLENGGRVAIEAQTVPAQDNQTFLHLLEAMWQQVAAHYGNQRVKKLSVTLHGLTEADKRQSGLFYDAQDMLRQKAERLSHAMDKLNQRYGRDTVLMGMTPNQGRSFSGTKIAFTRIPELQEFKE